MAKRKRTISVATSLGLPEVDAIIHHLQFKDERCTRILSDPIIPIKSRTKEDVISRLPDDTLQFIISSLSMREGAATCILSRRWRSLWTSSVSHLDFDIHTMLGHNYPRDRDTYQDIGKKVSVNKRHHKHLLKGNRHEFKHWVDQVLDLRSASRLDKLRVCFFLNNKSVSCVDRWIKYAVTQGVTDVELDFSTVDWPHSIDPRNFYQFPTKEDVPSLKYLRLKDCIFHIPRDFTGFASLVSLSMNFINITQSLVDNILSNCPLLKCLCLVQCCYYITTLTFSGPSLLKHLRVAGAFAASNMKKIEVHDVNLLSLEVVWLLSLKFLSLKNAPCLVRLVTSQHIETFSNIPNLETLIIQCNSIISRLCVLNNLKRLVFDSGHGETNFHEVLRVLQTCPLLQELELNMWFSPMSEEKFTEAMGKSTGVTRIHNNLKEVEIYGFSDRPTRIAFAIYLLKYAPALEKMKISTTMKQYRGNGKWFLDEISTDQESLEKVHKQLRKVARPSTKLEVSDLLNL